jgi:hypothetical protein
MYLIDQPNCPKCYRRLEYSGLWSTAYSKDMTKIIKYKCKKCMKDYPVSYEDHIDFLRDGDEDL